MKTYLKNVRWKDEDWLRQQYVEERKSIREIASECNVQSRTIAYWLKKLNVVTRSISKSMEGRRHSKETREKMSKIKRNKNIEYGG